MIRTALIIQYKSALKSATFVICTNFSIKKSIFVAEAFLPVLPIFRRVLYFLHP